MDGFDNLEDEEYVDEQCLNGKCPICDSKMYIDYLDDGEDYICKNGCYYYSIYEYMSYKYIINYRVFNRRWGNKTPDDNVARNEVMKAIKYWKKDGRYLIELMNT